jgi:type I restriction enzyme R subunit
MAKLGPEHSEWQTRKQLIDKELRAAGWRVTSYTEHALSGFHRCAVEEYPTLNGPADYALVLNGRVVGIVEAKN